MSETPLSEKLTMEHDPDQAQNRSQKATDSSLD